MKIYIINVLEGHVKIFSYPTARQLLENFLAVREVILWNNLPSVIRDLLTLKLN